MLIRPIIFPNYIQFSYGPVNCSIASKGNIEKFNMLLIEMIYRGFPITLGLIFTIAGYLSAIKAVKELPEEIVRQMNFNPYNLLWYPAVLILIFLPSVIDPIVTIWTVYRPTWVRALRMAIPHSIGFSNAVVYVILRKLYQKVEPWEKGNRIEEEATVRSKSVLFSLTTALRDDEA